MLHEAGESVSPIKIGNELVGDGCPTYVIAEIGINHNGDMEIAKKLIDVAGVNKVNAVKFQMRDMHEVYTDSVLNDPNHKEHGFNYLVPHLKDCELTIEEFKELKEYAESKGLQFLCTPFDAKSLEALENLDLPAYKIASADMTNFVLLKQVAATGKPMIVSTGMSTMDEIKKTASFLQLCDAKFMFLHCNSNYPAPWEHLNLNTIPFMKKLFRIPVGYSSHENGITSAAIAVAIGADLIEKHITLDRAMQGPDHAASVEPHGVQQLMKKIRQAELVMGKPKQGLDRGEVLNRQVLGKSLVAAQPIGKGMLITEAMVTAKSPGQYLSPQYLNMIIGTEAKRDIKVDEPFMEHDLPKIDEEEVQITPDFSTVWGFKGRFATVDPLVQKYNPPLFEFHFNDGDLELDVPEGKTYENTQLFIHAPEYNGKELVDVCSLKEDQRKRSIEILQKTIDKAVELQRKFRMDIPPKIVIHLGGYSVHPITDKERLKKMFDVAVESFKQLDYKGVVLLPENLPPKPWFFGGQYHQNLFACPEDLVEFCKRLNLKMCFDTSHASLYCSYANRSLEEFSEKVKDITAHLHISDALGSTQEGLQIGEGEINFERILGIFGERMKDITWVPEIWNGHLYGNKGFLEALKRLEKFAALKK